MSQAAFCGVSIVSMGCFDTLQAGSIGQGSGQNGVMVFGSDVAATDLMVPDAPIHFNSPPKISAPYQVTSSSVTPGFVEVTPIRFSDMNVQPTRDGIFGMFSTVASLVINGLNSLTGGFDQLVFSFLGQSNGNGNENVTFVVATGADTYKVGDILGQTGNVVAQSKTPLTESFSFAQFASAQTLTIYALSNDTGYSEAHFGSLTATATAPAPIPGAGFLSFLVLGFAKLRRRVRALWSPRQLAAQ